MSNPQITPSRRSRDFYEDSMADANLQQDDFGRPASFQVVNRRMPRTKQTGTFKHQDQTYDELTRRPYLINAGTQQAIKTLTAAPKDRDRLSDYFKRQGLTDAYADNITTKPFKGSVQAPREGEILFSHEPQLQVNGDFETSQIYESALLQAIDTQTQTANAAHDLAELTDKTLLEGASRQARGNQHSLAVTRAALIGGFDATSNVAYGHTTNTDVGGTHGHSYVMMKPNERTAFIEQAQTHGEDVCFLVDTYSVDEAVQKAFDVADKHDLTKFGFRLDSGDMKRQANYIRRQAQQRGYTDDAVDIVVSGGFDANKVREYEERNAPIDIILVGEYLAQPPGSNETTYQLQACQGKDGSWLRKGKISEAPGKATLPGKKQVWRVMNREGDYTRDIISLYEEDVQPLLRDDEHDAKPVLHDMVKNGEQRQELSGVNTAHAYVKAELQRFNNIEDYNVDRSPGVREAQRRIRRRHE